MKTKTREIVIKRIELQDSYRKAEGLFYEEPNDYKPCYVYEIETNSRLNLDALQHVITESVKVPEGLDEWMEVNGVGKSEIVEFLNNNYKKQ